MAAHIDARRQGRRAQPPAAVRRRDVGNSTLRAHLANAFDSWCEAQLQARHLRVVGADIDAEPGFEVQSESAARDSKSRAAVGGREGPVGAYAAKLHNAPDDGFREATERVLPSRGARRAILHGEANSAEIPDVRLKPLIA